MRSLIFMIIGLLVLIPTPPFVCLTAGFGLGIMLAMIDSGEIK